MRVVVDTNVLISAILKDKDPEAVLLFIIENPSSSLLLRAISDHASLTLRRVGAPSFYT